MAFDFSKGTLVTTPKPGGFDFSKGNPTTVADTVAQHQAMTATSAGNALGNIFPGAQLGKDVGSSIYGIGQGLKGVGQEVIGNKEGADQSFQNFKSASDSISPMKDFGDAASIGLTVGAPGVEGDTIGARIGNQALLNAGSGATSKIANGGNAQDTLKSAVVGGTIGAGTGAVSEALSYAMKNLPTWLTQKALPKLDSNNVDYALKNTKLGTIKTLESNSDAAVQSYGNQIHSILTHPQYANETGDGSASIHGVLQDFPNSKLTPAKVTDIVSKVVPGSEKLVDKISDGSATLLEKNQLRQQIDLATKKIFTDTPDVSFNKQVAASLASSLRNEVKSVAPETEPIFNEFSKEMNLNKALTAAQSKIEKGSAVGLYDILSGIGGFTAGGPLGSAGTIAAEKALRSPAVQIGAAKAVKTASMASPALNTIGKAIKPLVVRKVTQ